MFKNPKTKDIEYHGSSTDEIALLSIAKSKEYNILERDQHSITLQIGD